MLAAAISPSTRQTFDLFAVAALLSGKARNVRSGVEGSNIVRRTTVYGQVKGTSLQKNVSEYL